MEPSSDQTEEVEPNEAARLYQILDKIYKSDANKTLRTVLVQCFDCPMPDDTLSPFKAHLQLLELIDRLEKRLVVLPSSQARPFLPHVEKIKKAFVNASFTKGSIDSEIKSKITDVDLRMLYGCSSLIDFLPEHFAQIPHHKIDQLLNQVDQLMSDVVTADFDPDFATSIVAALGKLKFALKNYETFGSPVLSEAVAELAGRIWIAPVEKPEGETESVLRRLIGVAKVGSQLITCVRNGAAVARVGYSAVREIADSLFERIP